MANRSDKSTLLVGIVIFIMLPLLIGFLMYIRMQSMLHTYMEEQVTAQGKVLGQLAQRRLSVRLTELERVAGYFEDGRIGEDDVDAAVSGLLETPGQVSAGVLRLDSTAVSGKALKLSEYTAIRDAFRGGSAVSYREGEGLLFTAPIFNNGNVKYALYEFFDEGELFESFGDCAFQGQAILILADSAQRCIIPVYGEDLEQNVTHFMDEPVQSAADRLTKLMDVNATATTYFRSGSGEYFIFASNLNQSGLYLVGVVPHEVVASSLGSLSGMAVLLFGLLMILLVLGTIRVVGADARARESDELRRAKQIAEEASESKGRFLSSMSHELRTPINTIMGMNEMILRETGEGDTRERALDIKSASQILLGLINDVLDFSKIESGKLSVIPVEYDLTALIRDLVLLSENRAMAKSLKFDLEIDPELPVGLYGDDIRVQQVITNLLTNAVKYTQAGTVTLRMSGLYTGGDGLVLHCEVSDTGVGIKPEDIAKLKELTPFTRVDETRNRYVEGSGLGLPIIINLLRLMGSELQIKSVYGQGSTFSFDLEQRIVDHTPVGDIRDRLEASAKEYSYKVSCYAPRAHVLVVDDNSMNRKIFVSLLKPTGIQVSTASSGAKCLEMVRQTHFDLIFMDHLMPEMDGVETLQRLQAMADNKCRSTPVIALTANAFSGAREKYVGLGFDAFLAKPIVTEKLEAMLAELLPREYLEEAPAKRPAAQPEEDQPELPAIEGVNWEFALLHTSDHSLLLETLNTYFKGIQGEEEALNGLLERADSPQGMADYRTRVHSLKSTSAMVGILSVSEMARLLEAAARSEDRARVHTLHPVLLELLEQARERLQPFMGGQEEKEPMDDLSQLSLLLEMLRGPLEDMDISTADAVMGRIDHFSYPDQIQQAVDELSRLVSALDFDGARGSVDRLFPQLPEG